MDDPGVGPRPATAHGPDARPDEDAALAARRSPQEAKAFAAERRIASVRAALIAFNIACYYLLLPRDHAIPWLANTISVVAGAYAVLVVVLQPYRRFPVMRAALFTALTDGALIALWVAATGGLHSPFHLIWFVSLVAIAFRYQGGATAFATFLYIVSYLVLLALRSELDDDPVAVLVRCAYILLAGVLGTLLASDSAQAFALQQRLRRELDAQAAAKQREELERLREIDRFKTEFISTAAHELNSPLTPLQLQAHLLAARGEDPAVRAKALPILQRNAERMAAIIGDMLDASRLQAGRLRMEPARTDVVRIVREAIESFEDAAQARGIRFQLSAPTSLQAHLDPRRMGQVVYNLLSNALKYSKPGGAVHVQLRDDHGALQLEVRDEGHGFTAEQHARLFRPFSQVHRGIVDVPGTGLGLYICRGIIEAQGGTLTAHSLGPGKGASFRCVVPHSSSA